ncbi:hypothetical protein GUJ93_ZPchr0010g8716 [Zizania palustris]|uniref:Uncharacterized protein n=1 Tax=Zizania palustris TaxID=103762 RepID=A0A8J6BRW5_ZIZPA|nr:hypothetical protein GUJ93_ZPchr0010g8716 [Zizania palustris]
MTSLPPFSSLSWAAGATKVAHVDPPIVSQAAISAREGVHCAVRKVALASATLLTSPTELSSPDLALPRLPTPPPERPWLPPSLVAWRRIHGISGWKGMASKVLDDNLQCRYSFLQGMNQLQSVLNCL